ncbi:polysaccharide biosynthesis protein [Azohydromonas lata]|uniref:polysaccharide biosynthesis protein n=1 Tax=Azohydromonas lata TaxID=45677 RepID=UPI0008337389|nr:nucleoside-diphosphate sugar epimerase/dehydratase [Azohydromonas lata]
MSGAALWSRAQRLLTTARARRETLSMVVDGVVIALAWNATYLFRLGFERWWSARPAYDPAVMAGVIALYLAVFALLGIPRSMWRFVGLGELRRLATACFSAGAAGAVVVLMAHLHEVPRAVLALHPLMSLLGVCAVRVGYRMLYEHMRQSAGGNGGTAAAQRRALIMGAGEAARLLLSAIHRQGWRVVGLLDDDAAKQGARIAGVQVLGRLEDVAREDVRGEATHLIIAMPGAPDTVRRRALELAAASGLRVLTMPTLEELRHGASPVDRLRKVEAEDLLGRDPVLLDEAGIAESLNGKTVLITGAGGSIGSELCRQVARYGPARLVLYELSEFNLYSVEQELSDRFAHLPLVRLVGDVKDLSHLRATFARWRPQVVFHAAAFKHVPLMEENNAGAALRNNTLGTHHAALAAAEAGAERFVLISTDKAVNPTNVMGATKRAAELVVSHLAGQFPRTRFMAVRFGNVLGSSGSVIPKFKEQIARGGPVTVTHPDIIRYFMTIPEAARLVLQAAAIGESGQVLVLDMGEPVRIVDLARQLIRLAGMTTQEVPIVYSGLRPGEKLFEELLADDDTTLPTRFERLRIARLNDAAARERVAPWLARCEAAAGAGDAAVRECLRELVPEFRSGG